MKKFKSIALAFVVALSTLTVTAQTKKVDASKSSINWLAKKVTGEHSGTVAVKSGELIFNKKKLTGGNITVDMSSIATTDLKAGKGKEDLDGHLKSNDFFGTEKFPTSNIVFKTIAPKGKDLYTITADLTIKGKTSPVTFDMAVKGNTATTKLVVDRTKFDIKYKSKNFFENLGDKTIFDEFDLDVTLKI